MRKSIILASAAALILTACSDNANPSVMESEAADADAEAPASDFGFSQAIGEGAIVERATTVDIKEPPSSDIAVF
ncbi:MAG: hypothetical protein EBS78_11810 [Altererythrobacter sp.]|jgi:ABC-type enterochelin transport system substrate-binding protein|nr:hypothetical protein [Altererythrobacter sp.]